MAVPRIPLGADARLLVVTGAGISAESGLPTFRGAGGLWSGEEADAVATPGGLARDPERAWRFYVRERIAYGSAEPNAAHLALVALEAALGDRLLVVTQNIDGLHQKAGSARVLELHGSMWRTRCTGCDRPAFDDHSLPEAPPMCDRCGALLRPAITFFDEPVELDPDWNAKRFIKDAERARVPLHFLAVGTSGLVYPAAGYVRYARDFGAETWLANLEPAANEAAFDHVVSGPASCVLPALFR